MAQDHNVNNRLIVSFSTSLRNPALFSCLGDGSWFVEQETTMTTHKRREASACYGFASAPLMRNRTISHSVHSLYSLLFTSPSSLSPSLPPTPSLPPSLSIFSDSLPPFSLFPPAFLPNLHLSLLPSLPPPQRQLA